MTRQVAVVRRTKCARAPTAGNRHPRIDGAAPPIVLAEYGNKLLNGMIVAAVSSTPPAVIELNPTAFMEA